MTASSMFALFIGMFIIYNSFAIAVTQRRAEIGILRALGATGGQIRTLFLGESAVAGLIGSAAGAALGLVFARTLTGVSANMLESMFGVAQNVQEVVADPGFLLFAMAMGTGTSVVAALIPSRNAARVEPIQALQKGRYQVLGAGREPHAAAMSRCSPPCWRWCAFRWAAGGRLFSPASSSRWLPVCYSRHSCRSNYRGSCGAP